MKQYTKKCCMCEKDIIYQHGMKPSICPKCGREWWDKPKTECQLFYLQKSYLKDRNPDTLTLMYELLKVYARSLVLKILGGRYQMESSTLQEKSHDISVEIISLYLRKPKFKIDKSFGGYLHHKCRQELFGAKNEESHESLHQIITTKSSSKEIMDTLQILGFKSLFAPNAKFEFESEQLIQEIMHIIDMATKKAQKRLDTLFSLYFLIALQNKISGKTELFMNKYYSIFGQNVREKSEKILVLIYKLLKGENIYT